jgi:Lipase (class 3)
MKFLGLIGSVAAVALTVASTAGCMGSDAAEASGELALAVRPFSFRARAERDGRLAIDNAYWASVLAKISYASASDIPEALAHAGIDVKQPGYELRVFFLDSLQVQAFYLATPTAAFVSLRGTKLNIPNIAADVDIGPSETFVPGASVHRGFATQVDAIWNTIGAKQFVRDRHCGAPGEKPLYVTGHSMGGALAVLLSYRALADTYQESGEPRATRPYIPIEAVYTFGQTMLGDQRFVDKLAARYAASQTQYFRFVNASDGFPGVPEKVNFAHLEQRLSGASSVVSLTRLGRVRLGSLSPLEVDDRPDRPLRDPCGERGLRDHSIGTYVAKLHANLDGAVWQPITKCQ